MEEEEEASEMEAPAELVADAGTAVPGSTVVAKKPMSDVDVSTWVLERKSVHPYIFY